MVLLATRALAIASAGERRMWRSQLSTGVGTSIVLASRRGELLVRANVGRALRWIKDVKIALIRTEVLQHLLSRPLRIIISSRAESVKHVKLECLMVSAYVKTAPRSPGVSRKMCGEASLGPWRRILSSGAYLARRCEPGADLVRALLCGDPGRL